MWSWFGGAPCAGLSTCYEAGLSLVERQWLWSEELLWAADEVQCFQGLVVVEEIGSRAIG